MKSKQMSADARCAAEFLAALLAGSAAWPFLLKEMYLALGGAEPSVPALMVFGFGVALFVAFTWAVIRYEMLRMG